jgi:carotenoid cleavage dioxygenase-like enzyme
MTSIPAFTASPMTIDHRPITISPDISWATENKFLNGPFAPWNEESAGYDLPVIGRIPEDLAGALFRVTGNPRFQPRNLDRYHWWEGDGMVAALYIRDGKVAFRTSWVVTDSMKIETEAGEALYGGFVNGGTRAKLPANAPEVKNLANINAGIFDDHLLVYYEGGLPSALNPETLETLGAYDFHGGIDVLCTAHFKIDPATGDMLFFAAIGNSITWYRSDVRTGRIVDSHTFDVGLPVLMHDFTVSDNYAIFFVAPNMLRFDRSAKGQPGVVWDESLLPHGTQIVMMDRRTHAVTWYEAGGMFAPTHFFNAYERGDEVIINVHRISRLGNPIDTPNTPVSSHEWFPPAYSWQWTVNTRTRAVSDRRVSGIAGEFPKINDDYTGKDHRYGYFATTRSLSTQTMTDGMAKHDYVRDNTVVIEGPDGLTNPSEPVFVSRKHPVAEDDGYLLSLWWNPANGLSELLIHDATGFGAEPLARAQLPVRIPFGFHGNWADQAVLEHSIATLNERN